MEEFNLENYLNEGVENIVKGALKLSLINLKESLFMAKYAVASKFAKKIRVKAEKNGTHIPPFLIASITSQCNLHCKGCYARCNESCTDMEEEQLTDEEWLNIFTEARNIGVGFILLAGGEPLIRPDVINAAGKIQDILFPIFTNGTMIDDDYIGIFSDNRNLFPVLSMEGNKESTDNRRGNGVYEKLTLIMNQMKNNNIFYGASITVTTNNLKEVTTEEYLSFLYHKGCKVVFYIEYVPVDSATTDLAPQEREREYLSNRLLYLRKKYEDMLFISFPGDEIISGGCLAAGRGFFHINSHGGAEPCPFSPYSDTNLKHVSLKDALNSPLFKKLRENNLLLEDHAGGCVLFEQKENVEDLLSSSIAQGSN